MHTPLPTRCLAATALVLLASVGLTGCGSGAFATDEHWDDATAMRSSSGGDQVPSLVDPDATGIDLHVPQLGGRTVVRWASERGITRSDCSAGPVEPSTSDASWWPSTLPDEGWTCGSWTVYRSDGDFYAAKRSQDASGS